MADLEAVGPRLGILGHPLVPAALVVLVVNDHVVKAWSADQGVVARTLTGKASDVAGVLLLAVLVGTLTGRRRAAVVAVGLGFTALELSPTVATLAVPLLGGVTRTDPWDLIALAALVPASALLRRSEAASSPVDPRPGRPKARPRLGLVVLMLSVPAVTATSPPEEPCIDSTAVEVLVATDDGLLAAVGVAGSVDDHRDATQRRRAITTTTTGPSGGASTTGPRLVPPPLDWYASADVGGTWVPTPAPTGVTALLLRDPVEDRCTRTRCFAVSGSSVASQDRGGGPWSVREGPPVDQSTGVCSGASARVVTTDEVAVAVDGDRGLLRWTEATREYRRVSVGAADPMPVHVDGEAGEGGDDGDGQGLGERARSAASRFGTVGLSAIAVVGAAFLVLALVRARGRRRTPAPRSGHPPWSPTSGPNGPNDRRRPTRPPPAPHDPGDPSPWARPSVEEGDSP